MLAGLVAAAACAVALLLLQTENAAPRDLTSDQARVAAHVASYGHLQNPHLSGDLRTEHAAFLDLAPDLGVSAVAVTSGPWDDVDTWFSKQVPQADAQVLIPDDVTVTVEHEIDERLGWVRIDGELRFATTTNTRLMASTVLVSEQGGLTIGTPEQPIHESVTAELVFVPRSVQMLNDDLMDMAGGLLVHGDLAVHGTERTPHAIPTSSLESGSDLVRFETAPVGWSVGDVLLFADPTWGTTNDELREVEEIRDGGRTIVLDRPLDLNHHAAGGIGALPVANLTRNVVLRSEATDTLSDRGHVMVMHRHEPVDIEFAAFNDLGRTDTTAVHTIPALDDAGARITGTADNTIGRYGLHFHMRTGASNERPPHHVRGVVISGSPKHGLVNHGGNVRVQDSIGFNNAGAHFFTENGTELGEFTNNLAIRSTGSAALIRDRDAAQDFGHQGHGFWMTSAAVELRDNWAIGHQGMGIVLFGYPLLEDGAYLYFPESNVEPVDEQPGKSAISISDISFRYIDNTIVSSLAGLEIWVHKLDSVSQARSLIDGLRVAEVAYQGMNVFYAKDIDIRNVQMQQGTSHATGIGIGTNSMAENLFLENAVIEGFAIGYVAPTRGLNAIHNVTFEDTIGIQLAPPTQAGRHLELDEVVFGSATDQSIEMLDLRVPVNGDLSLLLSDDQLIWVGDGPQRLFFPSQHPDAVPFDMGASTDFGGHTTREMYEEFGISVGGAMAPSDATPFPGSNALVAELTEPLSAPTTGTALDAEELTPAQQYTAKFRFQYPGAWQNFRQADEVEVAADGSWRLGSDGAAVFADDEPPLFLLRPSLADLRIHPDDVSFGYRVDGRVYDRVGEFISVRAFTQDFHNLQVLDGVVTVSFTIHDMAGNELPVTLELEVTTEARRRLGHLSFFNELETGLSELEDMHEMALEHFGDGYTLTSSQG